MKYRNAIIQKRSVLTKDGKEVAVFHNGYEDLAKDYAEYLNSKEPEKEETPRDTNTYIENGEQKEEPKAKKTRRKK